jgi:hypothetical protein
LILRRVDCVIREVFRSGFGPSHFGLKVVADAKRYGSLNAEARLAGVGVFDVPWAQSHANFMT